MVTQENTKIKQKNHDQSTNWTKPNAKKEKDKNQGLFNYLTVKNSNSSQTT